MTRASPPEERPLSVAVGSRNPVKIEAAALVFQQVGVPAHVTGVEVRVDVGDQPVGDEQTRRGAMQRARGALAVGAHDFGIGEEGGIDFSPFGPLLIGWCAIVDRRGCLNTAASARVPLPPTVAERVRAGEELGPVMDEYAAVTNLKQKAGTVGFLTAGLVPRTLTWQITLAGALAPWLHPTLYRWPGVRLPRPPAWPPE